MSTAQKYLNVRMIWGGMALVVVSGCSQEGSSPTARDVSSADAVPWFEMFDQGEPQDNFGDSYADGSDRGAAGDQLDAGLVDASQMDRIDATTLTDASALDRSDVVRSEVDRPSGDAGIFMMGPVRHISAKDDLTCVVPASGEVYCWGFSPTFFPGVPVVEQFRAHRMTGYRSIISTGQRNGAICAIDEEGAVWCSGGHVNDAFASGLDGGHA